MITRTQFDGMTLEEREAYLERRAELERRAAFSSAIAKRPVGDVFMTFAAEAVNREPSLLFSIPALSKLVADRARAEGVLNPRGGGPYSDKTVYNYIAENRIQLLGALPEKLPGETPARVD